MGEFDPVPWEAVEATVGPPAQAVRECVDRMAEAVRDEHPYDAVKAIHDALAEADSDVPGLADPFVAAYLLERRGVIAPGEEYPSLVDRRPEDDRLRALFWERERTLWWIGLLTGVHPSLVSYWMYEAGIPLMERNYTAASLARIDEYRDGE